MELSVNLDQEMASLKIRMMDEIKEYLDQLFQAKQNSRWLKQAEVIEIYGLSRSSLYRLREAGKLNYSRFDENGGLLYYNMEEIESLLERNKTDAIF